MADVRIRQTPVVDVIERDGDFIIRASVADVRAEDVRVSVSGGMLEVAIPGTTSRAAAAVQAAPAPNDAEPPLSVPDEQDLWNAQRPLISEDRRTSLHLEGYSDEQANAIVEAVGDDAAEEAQGGSATGSDVFSEHGGFPSRNPEMDEES
jgi:hypothetical protein